jgi:Na+/H+ antiporter NhaD/arsenite permease-like protein
MPTLFSIPIEFVLFALTLLGVALLHGRTLQVAVVGALVISLYKTLFSPFATGAGLAGFGSHMAHEWVILANLFLLLIGFAMLANQFEQSHVPAALPKYLPDDWKGGFVLLVLIAIISAFLDNIAAAIIGGTVAATVYQKKVHIGFIAAIVAASNAGGAGSVVGDTTTTMMWIAGVHPLEVLEASLGAVVAIVIFGTIAAKQQHAFQPILKDAVSGVRVDWVRVGIVLAILAAAIVVNVLINSTFKSLADSFPFLGAAVWVAILITAALRKPDWKRLPEAAKGSVFLLCLVLCASMMPVSELPKASWQSALGLGFLSAVFDNIPLTALALKQGGYDWGFLAYAVGFGGSMLWFGSSAGVAIASIFPQARSVGGWLKAAWHIALAYVVGFFVMLAVLGWNVGTVLK